MLTEIEETDVVAPILDVPGTQVKAGMSGAVLVKAKDGTLLVEFVDDLGATIAEEWIKPASLRLVWSARIGKAPDSTLVTA